MTGRSVLHRLSPRRLVWSLGLSQIVGYGTLYYAFAILAPSMAATFGWTVPSVFAILSAALLASGIISPFAGRCIDRFGSAPVMAAGSAVSAAALLLVAAAPNGLVFALGVVAVELASPFVQYNAAFALLAERTGADARRRIVHLTLIAGFASTIFWPLTDGLLGVMSWQAIYAIYACLNLLCVPLHLSLRSGAKRFGEARAPLATPSAETEIAPLPEALRAKALVLVAAGFAFGGFLFSGISAQLVPLLVSVGIGGASVLVASLFGPAQVLVRFVNMAGGSKRHPIDATLAAALLLPVAVLVLAAAAPTVAGAAAFAILLGFGSGLTSIVRGTLPLALFGRHGYGERLGRISSAQLVSAAAAPVTLSFLIERLGAGAALAALAGLAACGALCFLAVARLQRRAAAGPAASPEAGRPGSNR
ncbi:MAG: arsenite efflux MFS transporter ArsK [Rhizobiaceae bacterium]|nr:arsenite efflux MFS transporter ArsK [Rhizobiaceae bacterium]